MLVPVREYNNAVEMLSTLMAIRRGFRATSAQWRRPSSRRSEVDEDVAPPPPAVAMPPEVRPIANDNEMDLMPRRVMVGEVLRAVSAAWGVRVNDVISARRTHDVMRPRQAAYALARRLTLYSLPQIAHALGGRDHTTILHGCRKMDPVMDAVEPRMRKGATVREWAEAVREEMGRSMTVQERLL
jgi:hypothetical protein